MAQFRITFAVLWLSWWCCCCWSFWSHQLGVECAPDELEDFPLDADADANANVDSDPDATVDFSTFYQRNSSRSDGQSAEDDVDDLNRVNEDESYETSGAAAAAQDRIVSFNKIMTTAMKEPTIRRSFAQVLPIIRAMSPTQRLTLATLVLKQLTSTTPTSSSSSSSPTLSALSHSNLQQLSNKSAELLLPISADIAAMLQSLKQTVTADANAPHSGRSTAFGTYYYNPLPAGYRVNNVQRPVLYSVRRRIQTSAAAERKKNDVFTSVNSKKMMPPPYVPSANVSYANFENKKPSQTQSQSPDKEDGNGFGHGHDESEEKNEDENSGEESDDYDSDEDGGGDRAANVKHDQERCRLFDDNICYDETYISYPSDRIANSIRNLEHKHVFGALVQDFVQNATVEHSPEIERRLGSPMPSTSTSTSTRGDALQLCASKIKYARPKKAKSTNGNWKFIVNTDHYTQTVRIETCVNADKTCSFLNENVKSHCVQIYNYHRLLTWDEKSGLSLDLFKVPTCCSCQIQQANANAFLPATTKNSKQPQPAPAAAADNDLQDNVIVDQSNVIYAPTIMKPKIKNKFNLTPLPLAPYNTLKRDSFVGKVKRPPHPSVLPLQHLDNGGLGLGSSSGIRRTSSKGNILKGVYVPGRGTLPEYTVPPGDVVNANVGAGAGGTLPHHRVNYNYHPIIDFFRSTAAAATAPQVAADRADADTDRDADMAATIDEWLPMTEGPRSARRRRAIATATATAVQL